MKKFNYSIDPTKQVSLEFKKEIREMISSNIKYQKFNFKEVIIFSYAYLIFSWITFLIIGWLLLWYRAKVWLRYNEKNTGGYIPVDIYKKLFESQYTNVKVEKVQKFNLDIIRKNRGPSIPSDAIIYQNNFGPVFKIDNLNLKTLWVNWKWKRSNGDSTQSYYYKKIYLYSDNIKDQFSNLHLVLKKGNLFSKKGHDLENTTFNHKFWYDYNNGVSARLFFPVSAQENWVEIDKDKKNYNSLKGFQLMVSDDYYLFGRKEIYKSKYGVLLCDKVVNNKEAFIDGMYNNILKDIKEISASLRLALVNKYFFK